jgi:penicillin-binding protein 1A
VPAYAWVPEKLAAMDVVLALSAAATVFGLALGLTVILSLLRQRRRQSSHSTIKTPIAATVLRTGVGVVLVVGLGWVAILTLMSAIAQSGRWDLPSGTLLETVLTACQFEHSSRDGVDSEHMICPTRLAADDFPQVLQDAVLASEDARFFSHGAIDPRSTLRAAWHWLRGNRQGGSTITQQLARSLLLKKEDSLGRKVSEAVAAVRISALLTRSEILTRYMNAVPHARNMNGFDDPARYYFGVGVQKLDLAEAALLVSMLPEPNNRDPLRNPTVALVKADDALQHMVNQQKITAAEAANAKAELKRRLLRGTLRRGDDAYKRVEYRPYRDLAIREAHASGINLGGDYRLIAFMDPDFQQALVTQVCSITGRHQAAGFFMHPSGEVLATTGSCTYTGEWNRATDSARSIGSTGKLFPLIGIHEMSASLKDQYPTAPIKRPNWPAEPNSRCLARTTVSLGFALAQSCNRPWTEASIRMGPRLSEIVRRFDLTPGAPALIPIGGIHTSPMKLAKAYASLQNRGAIPEARYLIATIGSKGNVIGQPAIKSQRRVMSPSIALAVLHDLRGPVKSGTARAANSLHAMVYGKTGTSSRNEDALFVGLTEDFVGSLWLGYDQPTPMPGVHGGGTPANAFSKLTDFYYLRLAQSRLHGDPTEAVGYWAHLDLRHLALRNQRLFSLVAFGSALLSCLLLSRRRQGHLKVHSRQAFNGNSDSQQQPSPQPHAIHPSAQDDSVDSLI